MHSLSVYDLVSRMLRARPVTERQRRDAFAAPLELWTRVLGFEGCTVQFERALQGAGLMRDASPPLRRMLRDATGASVRHAGIAHVQLIELAELAAGNGIRALMLKGAARLLAGAPAGTRSLADVDLLVQPADASRLHLLLQSAHGYSVSGPAQHHHLAPLARAGSLSVEIHVRLTHVDVPLDGAIWTETTSVPLGRGTLEIPSPTNILLHAMEHATTLNWMSRYRLRDILDVAACFTSAVPVSAVDAYLRLSPHRAALETLVSAAHEIEPRAPRYRPAAWSTVRRVSRARLALAVLSRNGPVAERLFRYAGVLAEGSPATMGRAVVQAARWRGAASVEATGRVGSR